LYNALVRTAVVLFTRDLRLHDQPALAGAAATSEAVVPLFVLDDGLVRRIESPNRLTFLLESLADLRSSLRERGGDLVVRRGDAVAETLRLAQAVGADSVFVGRGSSSYAQRRQDRLGRECDRLRLALRVVNTTTVVAPGALATAERDHYRIFTPYWRRWREAYGPRPVPPPERVHLPGGGLEPGELPPASALTRESTSPALPRGGERAARARLDRWLTDGLPCYGRPGATLSRGPTSRLSPYLHFGCVSPVELAARVRHRRSGGGEEFLRQLAWRDFYEQLLAANPATPHEDLRPRGRSWAEDEEALARWAEGRTGYPIVDAGMRQLTHEGWLPNRARLIVASFLTKTLSLDWRSGAAVFARLLVDGDVACNVGNWQWMAGTGVDTRPNRVLNPVRQAKRFDPEGEYVRRYVPELAQLDGASVHEPCRSPSLLVPPEYPEPLGRPDGVDAAA
jgi:deoxyribodipyrimidine photo-lyase